MSEVERRPAGTMSRERRFGIAISLGLILGGGWWAASELGGDAAPANLSFPVSGQQLQIDARSSDVWIRSGDVQDIQVRREGGSDGLFSSGPKETYENGELELRASCGPISFGRCEPDYVITVPRDLRVRIETSSGDVEVENATGPVDVKSSSGDVIVNGANGDVVVETTSGDVTAEGLRSSTARVKASSGDLELRFATAPTTVTAETSSGDVDVTVPDGTETYRVDTDTSSGDTETGIRTDPASTRTIRAETSSGDVTVEYGDG
jgi:putative adhesin